jgi:hypothetical protein
MNLSLLRFLLEHEIHIAIQTAGEYFPCEDLKTKCRCLRFGMFENLAEDRPDMNEAVNAAWEKF